MTVELDRADRRILFELDCDSRQSLSELSKKIHLGRDLVTYRIDKLVDRGVLKRCTLMINPYKLGLTVYKTYFRLETNKARVNQLVSYLNSQACTYWIAECYGKWDLVSSILARTPKEFYDFQDRLLSDFRDVVLDFNVYTLVNYWWFPKKHLLGDKWQEERKRLQLSASPSQPALNGWGFSTPEFTFGTTPDQYALDHLEYKMIDLLGKDARLSYAEVAERLSTSVAVVKYRLEKLMQRGVVAGFRVDIDRTVLGMTLFKVMVHLRDYDVAKEQEFREFCRTHPHISCYVQQIGDTKVEFEVEASDHIEFNQVMDQIRERFHKYIRSMDYMVITKDHDHRTPCNLAKVAGEVSATNDQAEAQAAA